jgi:hypothetical protein
MKTFLIAATVAAGLLCSTSTADAQILRRNRVYYPVYTTYDYPVYTTYAYPSLSPTYSSADVVVTSGYSPTYTYPSYSYYTYPTYSRSYYDPSYYYSSPGSLWFPDRYYPSIVTWRNAGWIW